jgi:hypothetical protein
VTKPTEEILLTDKDGVKPESVASLVRKMIALVGEDPER